MACSDLGDDHKSFFAGDKALKSRGNKNTINQFEMKNKKAEVLA
jgi:isocitrate lyase